MPRPISSSRHRSVTATLLLGLVACHGSPPRHAETRAVPALSLPPSEQTAGAFDRLAAHDSCASDWTALRYLLDLQALAAALHGEADEVSRTQRRAARRCLDTAWRLTGATNTTPPTTDGLAALLHRRVTDFMARCAPHPEAQQALALLQTDRLPRVPVAPALRAAVAYKRVLLTGTAMAAQARLRLVKWCATTFRQATRSPARHQQAILNGCLFALYEADPSPYFDVDPWRRPPDPPWTSLRNRLQGWLGRLAHTRFAYYAQTQAAFDRAFFRDVAPRLPSSIDLRRFSLPTGTTGQPLDRVPVVALTHGGYLVDSRPVPLDDDQALQRAIANRVQGDPRAALALVSRPRRTLHQLFAVARAARANGVRTLYLGVIRQVARRTPPGDVQAEITSDGRVWRLEGLPLSLALLRNRRSGALHRDAPRALDYDPQAAGSRLALSAQHGQLQLSSAAGRLPPLSSLQQLPAQLQRLRRAYPDQASLIIAPGRNLHYVQLVALVQNARFQNRRPLFPALALTPYGAVQPPERMIDPLVTALASSRVRLVPPRAPQSLHQALHRCYRAALSRAFIAGRALPSGTVRPPRPVTRRSASSYRASTAALARPQLRRCVEIALSARTAAPPQLIEFRHD